MSLSLGTGARVGHVRLVPTETDTEELRLWGRALRLLRKKADLTQDQAAEAYARLTDQDDFTGQGWGLIESGKRKYLFSPVSRRQLAAAVNATSEDFDAARLEVARQFGKMVLPQEARGVAEAPQAFLAGPMAMLPVRDRVQAGAWLQADDYVQTAPRTYPALRDPRYHNADQWLSEVVGDSVDRLNIFEGDLVHCVDAIAAGYHPRTGDVVEVERLRFGGQMRELTLKQIQVTEGAVLLWPRSTNPRWQEPLSLLDGADEDDGVEVRIRALVINLIRRLSG
jgi:SOS-response transcriptional repressor LexA